MALKDDRPPTFEEALAPLVERLVAKYIQRHVAPPGWLAHTASPLGRARTAALCRSGRLPGVRLQGTKLWLIRSTDLEAFIAANTAPAGAGSTASAPATEDDVVRELDRALAKAGKRRRVR